MKIAILYLCTGDYSLFWEGFFNSCEKNLFPNSEKHYFVYTDKEHIYKEDSCNRIIKIYQENLGWPEGTLLRFKMFMKIKEQLEKFDYIFFMNANLNIVNTISEDEILNNKANLYMFKQPGYYKCKAKYFPYDRNSGSLAYIPYNLGEHYVFGAINGGKSKYFIELIETLDKNVDIDMKNNIYAKWLDESHLNRYILNRNDVKIFSPEYCYPEGWDLPFEKKIEVLDKSKYFDVNKIKKFKNQNNRLHNYFLDIYCKAKINLFWIRDTILRKSV